MGLWRHDGWRGKESINRPKLTIWKSADLIACRYREIQQQHKCVSTRMAAVGWVCFSHGSRCCVGDRLLAGGRTCSQITTHPVVLMSLCDTWYFFPAPDNALVFYVRNGAAWLLARSDRRKFRQARSTQIFDGG